MQKGYTVLVMLPVEIPMEESSLEGITTLNYAEQPLTDACKIASAWTPLLHSATMVQIATTSDSDSDSMNEPPSARDSSNIVVN
jgi:hypothetical protein